MFQAARKAASLLLRHYGRVRRGDVESKALNDFVTFVDRRSQVLLIDHLKRAYPDYGFLAEEEGVHQKKKRMWIIDPLDGTANYIHGFPLFCISIGLAEDLVPFAGLVYDPIHDECFTAWKGKGARLNGKRIYVSKEKKMDKGFIATGFPFRHRKHYEPYHESFRKVFYRSAGLRRGGSAALDLCHTAAGRFDAFWEYGLSPWDVAAGAVIVEEAGGKVTDFKGRAHHLDSRNLAAGNPFVHPELVKVLRTVRGFC